MSHEEFCAAFEAWKARVAENEKRIRDYWHARIEIIEAMKPATPVTERWGRGFQQTQPGRTGEQPPSPVVQSSSHWVDDQRSGGVVTHQPVSNPVVCFSSSPQRQQDVRRAGSSGPRLP